MNETDALARPPVLVTGSAGFIGFHLSRQLLDLGRDVVGLDAMTDYYDVNLKRARREILEQSSRYQHLDVRIENAHDVESAFKSFRPTEVVHLAAQAGVRYALQEPRTYVETNIVGSFNILEAARVHRPRHLLLASTSSVYGANSDFPYQEVQRTDHPLSFYAATKKAVEDLSHSYSHLHNLPTTSFRFFTVYGSWGRPDMALFKFVRAAFAGEPIPLHNDGLMRRDFTHISDLVRAIEQLMSRPPVLGEPVGESDSLSPAAPYRSVNIGGGSPITVLRYIEAIEKATGRPIVREFVPAVPGEVPVTHADPALLRDLVAFSPGMDVDSGVQEFVDWYRSYYL